eukprot:TRINITY_DN7059_c0_g1_i1.p1 TRINITY_DN7059_c0_g1~~TRINITY_DN7059_c0_g1_i1.p1  ORF type:complete len:901 (+),score=156.67 TRINITY_DN7059_c0_g1_i1:24-2705(+)
MAPPANGATASANLSRLEKMLVVAPFMPCCHKTNGADGKPQRCTCTGWKRPQPNPTPGAPSAVAGQASAGASVVPTISASGGDDACLTCAHKMTAHGELATIAMEELDRRVSVIKEILHLTRSVREALASNPNPQLQQAYYQQMLVLKEKLFRPKPMDGQPAAAPQVPGAAPTAPVGTAAAMVRPPVQQPQPNVVAPQPQQAVVPGQDAVRRAQEMRRKEEVILHWLGSPPFDDISIVQIMKNFMQSRFPSPTAAQTDPKYAAYEKLCLLIIGVLNRHDLMHVEEHMKQYQQDRMYQMNFQRWLRYCRERGQYFKAFRYNLSDIFGRTMLASVFMNMRKLLETTYNPPADLRPYLPVVLNELARELNDPESIIFRKDFADRLASKLSAAPVAGPASDSTAPAAAAPFLLSVATAPLPPPMSAVPLLPALPVASSTAVPSTAASSQPPAPSADATASDADRKRKRDEGDVAADTPPEKVVVVPVSANPPQISVSAPVQGARASFLAPNALQHAAAQSTLGAPAVLGNTPIPVGEGIVCGTLLFPTMPGQAALASNPAAKDRSQAVEFRVISNNSPTEQVLIWMVQLKNIFSKQLPKMPKEYIARMVFDRNHRNLALLRGSTPIGGICYRPFPGQNFAEIVFLAVVNTEQVKGWGSHLMNHLKEFVKREHIGYFLTYADNFAVNFFKKQGFTINVTEPRDKWWHYIKDYEGGTLMECQINQKMDYLTVRDTVKKQREAILEKIKVGSHSHVVHEGLKQPEISLDAARIPGMENVKSKPEPIPAEEHLRMREIMWKLFSMVKGHRDAWPFQDPVDGSQVRDYYEIVKDPIDLQMIERRLQGGVYYKTLEIFLADLKRMLNNCKTYNADHTYYYKAADTLNAAIVRELKRLMNSIVV